MMRPRITVWCVTDHKPGHKSQLEGLANAISSRVPSTLEWIGADDPLPDRDTPAPDLILTAGHKTHIRALRLKWRHGGKLVVLMKPTLPRWLFDLCLVPEHDGLTEGKRILNTRGALNTIHCDGQKDEARGLVLIGGPSKHYGWEDRDIIRQLHRITGDNPDMHWTLTTSRRTPGTFLDALGHELPENLSIVPVEQTDRDWLIEQYTSCGSIWVSEDSVSMVYESLSSGARVGILKVPRINQSRVSKGLDKLLENRFLYSLDSTPPETPPPPLQEADRAAAHILDTLLPRIS